MAADRTGAAARPWWLVPALLLGLLLSTAATATPVQPPLWKVSGKGQQVYLLGSFHLLRAGDERLADEVTAALGDVDEVVFELAPEDADSPALRVALLQAAQRRRGGTLEQDLGPALWGRLQDHARRTGLPLAQLSAFEPWFVSLTVSIAELQRHRFDPALGLDRQLMRAAAAAGHDTAGLERVEDQVAALSGMDVPTQVQMLEQSLDQVEDGPGALEDMYAAWRTGDAARLWEAMGAEMKREHPALYRRINVARNEAWLPRIEQRLRSGGGNVLVVVGALHLLGEDGLVERLRARGYTVRRVCRGCSAR